MIGTFKTIKYSVIIIRNVRKEQNYFYHKNDITLQINITF